MLIKPNQMSMMVGPAASGKSFVALDLACSVARGVPWMGWPVLAGGVAYVTRDPAPLARRIEAWAAVHPASSIMNFWVVMAEDTDLAGDAPGALTERVLAVVDEPVDLVVLDDFNGMIGNANSAADIGRALEQIDHLIAAVSTHVMIVCQQGKLAFDDRVRGRPLIGAVVDLILGVNDRTVMVLKQAIGPAEEGAIDPIQARFDLRVVALPGNITTCVAVPV